MGKKGPPKGVTNNPKGRPVGIKDKRHRYWDVRHTLERLGCDPAEILAKMALDESLETSIRQRALSDLRQISYPTLKSVEIKRDETQHDEEMSLLKEAMKIAEKQHKKSY